MLLTSLPLTCGVRHGRQKKGFPSHVNGRKKYNYEQQQHFTPKDQTRAALLCSRGGLDDGLGRAAQEDLQGKKRQKNESIEQTLDFCC